MVKSLILEQFCNGPNQAHTVACRGIIVIYCSRMLSRYIPHRRLVKLISFYRWKHLCWLYSYTSHVWNRDGEKYFQSIVILSLKKTLKWSFLVKQQSLYLYNYHLCTLLSYVTKVVQYNNPGKLCTDLLRLALWDPRIWATQLLWLKNVIFFVNPSIFFVDHD